MQTLGAVVLGFVSFTKPFIDGFDSLFHTVSKTRDTKQTLDTVVLGFVSRGLLFHTS